MRSADPTTRYILTVEHKIMKHYNSQSNLTVDNRAHHDIALFFLLKMARIISLTRIMRTHPVYLFILSAR